MVRYKNQSQRIEFEILGVAEKIVGQVQLRALQTTSIATPVDTGFARSDWRPSVGSPIVTRSARPKSEAEAKAIARSQRAEHNAKARIIATGYKIKMGPAFITNAVPYMKYLNEGSSAQAPKRFVERAVETAVKSFNGRRL